MARLCYVENFSLDYNMTKDNQSATGSESLCTFDKSRILYNYLTWLLCKKFSLDYNMTKDNQSATGSESLCIVNKSRILYRIIQI